MRSSQRRSPSTRRLTFLLATVLLPPVVALLWLGAALLDLDRAMLAERRTERRKAATEIVTRALVQSMSEAERWLVQNDIPEGAARLSRSSAGVDVWPRDRVLWVPELPQRPEAAREPFADAERAELQGIADRGVAVYTSLARSSDRAIRAGALIRLARAQRRAGKADEAIRSYRQLAAIGEINVHNTPADLVARRMICEILDETSRTDDLAREAGSLRDDLLSRRWVLDRAAFELAAADLAKWTDMKAATADRLVLSAAIDWANSNWLQLPASGRRAVIVEDTPVTMVWQRSGSDFKAVAVTASIVDQWIRTALERELPSPVLIGLVTEAGQFVAGHRHDAGTQLISRPSSESGLPWVLTVSPAGVWQADSEFENRRWLLGAGVAALVLLLAGGSYLLWRLVRRELAVARLQTDFVAAVSHEFRTPLTSLQHMTDLLQESDELPPGRRQAMYAVLGQSTGRLRRLVESLLDFARMEDGRKPWSLGPVNLSGLVEQVVSSFRSEHAGIAIEMDAPLHGAIRVNGDSDALTHALWNLLDNAVKYSPEGGAIRVSVHHDARGAAIQVRDSGLGIAAAEQKEIFGKFVRGRTAIERGIAGTGLGLAMVSHIVSAHGGRVDVQSQPEGGSTFTIILPIVPSLQDSDRAVLQPSSSVYDGER